MEKNFKLVFQSHCKDQYLISFHETKDLAIKKKLELQIDKPEWISDADKIIVKPVDVEMIPNPIATDYSHYCRSLIPDEEYKHVMGGCASAEIDCNNIMCGFGGGTYYNLSKMIPKAWNVIDIGASYGAQSYFFQHHNKYIAVEPYKSCDGMPPIYNFQAKGTERYDCTCGQFIKDIMPTLELDLECTFAIVHYVPSWFGEDPNLLARQNFRNLFCFYPFIPKPLCA